jgi:hypothetical protein
VPSCSSDLGEGYIGVGELDRDKSEMPIELHRKRCPVVTLGTAVHRANSRFVRARLHKEGGIFRAVGEGLRGVVIEPISHAVGG